MTNRERVSYVISVSTRNRCATATVYRVTGGRWRRRVARTSWAVSDDATAAGLATEARRQAWPLIVADQRKRGVRRAPPPPHGY